MSVFYDSFHLIFHSNNFIAYHNKQSINIQFYEKFINFFSGHVTLFELIFALFSKMHQNILILPVIQSFMIFFIATFFFSQHIQLKNAITPINPCNLGGGGKIKSLNLIPPTISQICPLSLISEYAPAPLHSTCFPQWNTFFHNSLQRKDGKFKRVPPPQKKIQIL